MSNKSDIKTAIESAKEMIADPEQWCKGAGARNRDGEPVMPNSRFACQWSTTGALVATTGHREEILRAAYIEMEKHVPAGFIDVMNAHNRDVLSAHQWLRASKAITAYEDDKQTTHADVVAVLDKTIDATRGRRQEIGGR